MSRKRTTDAHAVYTLLTGFADNVIFTTSYMRKRIPTATSGGVGNILHKLTAFGALDKLRRSEFKLNKEKLLAFGENRHWKSNYTSGKRRTTIPRVVAKHTPTDIEVLGELLAAMVKAEPIIKKYITLATAVDTLNLKE